MNTYAINGIQKDLASLQNQSLRELIHQIREAHSNESTLISSILVNGIEIDANDERLLGTLPVAQLRSLEIFTAHPREIAEETLQSLVEFTRHLERMCEETAKDITLLPRLADGITTFIDALENVKQILHVSLASSGTRSVQVLEADLASILRDMLEYRQKKEMGFLASILGDALSPNLALWRTEGLPALIRARDS